MTKTVLSVQDIKAMFDAAESLRDQAMIAFLADTGCRVSEMLAVSPEDLDFDAGTARIPHLKLGIKKLCPGCGRMAGAKQKFCVKCGADMSGVAAEGEERRDRIIQVGSWAQGVVKTYLDKKNGGSYRDEIRVFNITRASVDAMLRRVAEKSGLTGKMMVNPETGKKHYISAHKLRDAFAVDWLSTKVTNAEAAEVQKALQLAMGHKRYETTARYQKLTPQTQKQIADQVRKGRFDGSTPA
jgi:integrase